MAAAASLLLALCLLTPSWALPFPEWNAGRPSSSQSPSRNHSRVLIIGAGASGIAAAARLMENNFFDVTILEAEKRFGGRIHTVRFAEDLVELGAEWVHGEEGNVVFAMAEPLGLLGRGEKIATTNMVCVWSGGAVADPEQIAFLYNTSTAVFEEMESESDSSFSGSMEELFREKFGQRLMTSELRPPAELVDRYLDWYGKAVAFSEGDTWSNVSTRGHYEECKGDQTLNWKRFGYLAVLGLLTKRIPDASQELPVYRRVLLGSEVRTIHWGERVWGATATGPAQPAVTQAASEYTVVQADTDLEQTDADSGPTDTDAAQADEPQNSPPPVVVELSDGARYTADMVLVTVSLGVLKHSADVLFDPPLPEPKMKAIRNLGFGQVNKLFMYFAEPWWPHALSGYSVLVTEEDLEAFKQKYPQYGDKGHWVHGLSGFYIDQHKPNVVLMDWMVGWPARVMERYSDYQVMSGCKDWLDMFLGQNFSIPMPVGFTRSKWWSNPHFRGSYSYRSLDSDNADAWAAHLAEPILDARGLPAVMFAGEATHDHYYSTVHGAIESGWREADRILNAIRSEKRFQT